MKKKNLPIEKIRYWIEQEKKTKRWVAQQLGISVGCIQRRCKKYGIRFEWPIEKIRKLVEIDGLKHWEVGEKLGIDAKYVSNLCKMNSVKSQRRGPRSGPEHPDWRGGHTVNCGYLLTYCPGHPRARKPVPYVQEHRLVMEKYLARYLLSTEVVHHINGNKLDNRLENLKLFQRNSEHLKEELTGKTPNWTEDGKHRIREALRKAHGNQKELRFCDSLKPQNFDHSINQT